MKQACTAKLHPRTPTPRPPYLSTGNRPLEHRTRRDSRTIPGIIMAAIWNGRSAPSCPARVFALVSADPL